MIKQTLKKVPFLISIVPSIYLSLLIDYHSQSPIGFILTLISSLFLGFYSKCTNQLKFLFIGNLISFLISYYLCVNLDGSWDFFYKPFTLQFLVVFLAVLFILPELIGIGWGRFFTKQTSCQ